VADATSLFRPRWPAEATSLFRRRWPGGRDEPDQAALRPASAASSASASAAASMMGRPTPPPRARAATAARSRASSPARPSHPSFGHVEGWPEGCMLAGFLGLRGQTHITNATRGVSCRPADEPALQRQHNGSCHTHHFTQAMRSTARQLASASGRLLAWQALLMH